MRGLGPRIHVFLPVSEKKDVDGWAEPGHDDFGLFSLLKPYATPSSCLANSVTVL
jgi:hypothetical protein